MTFCCLTSVKTWWVGISLFSIFLNTTKVHSFFFYSQLPILLHCLCSKEIFTAATLSCCSNSPFTKRHTNQQFAVKSFWVIVIEVTHTYRYYHYISNFSLKKKKKTKRIHIPNVHSVTLEQFQRTGEHPWNDALYAVRRDARNMSRANSKVYNVSVVYRIFFPRQSMEPWNTLTVNIKRTRKRNKKNPRCSKRVCL